MHILRLNAVPDSEAHSQLGVCEITAHRHTDAEMMSTFNNSCWRLHHRIRSEDKDSLIHGWDVLKAKTYCWHFKAVMWLALVSCRPFEIGGCWIKFPPSCQIVSVFPWGRAEHYYTLKLNSGWSHRSNTTIQIPWVWVAANLNWLGTGLSN